MGGRLSGAGEGVQNAGSMYESLQNFLLLLTFGTYYVNWILYLSSIGDGADTPRAVGNPPF